LHKRIPFQGKKASNNEELIAKWAIRSRSNYWQSSQACPLSDKSASGSILGNGGGSAYTGVALVSPRFPHEAHRIHRSCAGCTHRNLSQRLAGSSGEVAQECPGGGLRKIS
jgi:hypothetical protein